MLLVMFVFGIIMSAEVIRTEVVAAEDGDEEEFNQVGGLIDWIPGVSTAKAAFNYYANPVKLAVKFTNANTSASALALAAATGGASFVTALTVGNPIAANSFLKIAKSDKLWNKYCAELSKTNNVVTCDRALKGIRERLQQINEDATSTVAREEKKVSIWNPKDWKFKGKAKTTKQPPIHGW